MIYRDVIIQDAFDDQNDGNLGDKKQNVRGTGNIQKAILKAFSRVYNVITGYVKYALQNDFTENKYNYDKVTRKRIFLSLALIQVVLFTIVLILITKSCYAL